MLMFCHEDTVEKYVLHFSLLSTLQGSECNSCPVYILRGNQEEMVYTYQENRVSYNSLGKVSYHVIVFL